MFEEILPLIVPLDAAHPRVSMEVEVYMTRMPLEARRAEIVRILSQGIIVLGVADSARALAHPRKGSDRKQASRTSQDVLPCRPNDACMWSRPYADFVEGVTV